MPISKKSNRKHSPIDEWAATYRKPVSMIVATGCLMVLIVSEHSWPRMSAIDLAVEFLGFVLICVATFGRIWCALYYN